MWEYQECQQGSLSSMLGSIHPQSRLWHHVLRKGSSCVPQAWTRTVFSLRAPLLSLTFSDWLSSFPSKPVNTLTAFQNLYFLLELSELVWLLATKTLFTLTQKLVPRVAAHYRGELELVL